MKPTPIAIRAIVLLLTGVLIFADSSAIAMLGLLTTITALLFIGFTNRHAIALLWSLTLIASAIIADTLWQLGWPPYDRSADYEAIPQTPFVILGLPLPMAIIGLGIILGLAFQHLRSSSKLS